jgi:hypothetical protein
MDCNYQTKKNTEKNSFAERTMNADLNGIGGSNGTDS